jgi:hypothetical protein
MKHVAIPRFWKAYEKLPVDIQKLADEHFSILKSNPSHPSLYFKKIDRFWSVRIGLHWRALAIEDDATCIWFWIGSHAEYDRLLKLT